MDTLMPYSGKPINRMTYDELLMEKTVNQWFAARMVRLYTVVDYGLWNRKAECDRLYDIEASEEQFRNGEIDEDELKRRKKNRKMRLTYIGKVEAEIEFCKMQEINARAIVAIIDEELQIKKRPVKRKKVETPYRRLPENFIKHKRKLNNRRAKERQDELHKFATWQRKIEKTGLGSLWDRDKFELICGDRGYVTRESQYALVSKVLEVSIKQTTYLMRNGAFTWGQVLTLGAVLYMNPKEFCDTFLAGYFAELTDGVFEASTENVPDYSNNYDY